MKILRANIAFAINWSL